MARPTGIGKIETDRVQDGYYGSLKAKLYNYDISGHELKSEHKKYLKDFVVPLLHLDRGTIWMQGTASQTGSNAYNLALSKRRVGSVVDFLLENGVQSYQIQAEAVGEEFSFMSRNRESEADRAVQIVTRPFIPRWNKPKKEVPPPPTPRPKNKQFKIRHHAEIAVGFLKIVGVTGAIFEIFDVNAKVTTFYVFDAAGFSKGFGSPVSATPRRGPWNDFSVNKPLAANEFSCEAIWLTAGAGNVSTNSIEFVRLKSGATTFPRPIPVETNFTIGAGVAAIRGNMRVLAKLAFDDDDGLWPGELNY